MPITIPELIAHTEELGFKIIVPPDRDTDFGLRFATSSYLNPEGEHSLLLICQVADDGRYLEVFAPGALNAASCKYKGALFATMVQLSFMTKHLQIEHDPSDGEIRLAVDLPVVDGTVTARQLSAMIHCLIHCLEEYYPVLRHAMDTGRIDFGRAWKPPEAPATEPPPIPPELQALIDKAGGIENLEAIVDGHRKARERS